MIKQLSFEQVKTASDLADIIIDHYLEKRGSMKYMSIIDSLGMKNE